MANSVSKTVKIKHGLFFYHESVSRIIGGEEKDVLVERLAFHGEEVTLTRNADIERGNEVGAFYSDAELKALAKSGTPDEAPVEENEADYAELDQSELVDWLMSTGEFDGKKKPTAPEVVSAAGNDPDLAQRLLDAEDTASGSNPRQTVVDGLEKIIADADEEEE